MATPEEQALENLKKARIEFAQYKREFEELSNKKFPDPFDGMKIDQIIKKYGSMEKAMDAVRLATKGVRTELNEMGNSFDTIKGIVDSIGQELKAIQNPLNAAKNAYRKIRGVVSDIEMMQADILSYDKKSVDQAFKKNKEAFLTLKLKKQELEQQSNTVKAELDAQKGNLSYEQIRAGFGTKALQLKLQELEQIEESISLTEDELGLQKDINTQLKLQQDRIDNINEGMGITGGLLKGIGAAAEKIGFKGFSEKLDKVNEGIRAMSFEMTQGGTKALDTAEKGRIMGAAIGGVFQQLKSSLKDPLVQLTLAVALFKKLSDIGMHASQAAMDIARNLGQTKDDATKAYHSMYEMSLATDSAFTSASDLVKANQELNASLGTSVTFSKEFLEMQSLLTNQMGMSGDEAASLARYTAMTGKSGEAIVDSVLAQGDGLINNRELLKETLTVSADTAALYDNNPPLIAKAVMETKKLGMSLQQAKNIASGLLDFESSIDAEMEAQLLTGRNMNLARARELALQGKSAEAAAEARRQIGSYADYMKQGPLAQQATAKALGMSTEELAKQLQATELIDQIRRENPGLSQEQLTTEAMRRQLSASERLGQSMQTLKDSFASLIEGPLAAVMDGLSYIFKGIAESGIGKFFGSVAGLAAGLGGVFLAYKGISGFVKNLAQGRAGERRERPLFVEVLNGLRQGAQGDYSSDGGVGGGYYDDQGRYRDKKSGKYKKDPKKQGSKTQRTKSKSKAPSRGRTKPTRRRGRGRGGAIASALSFMAPDIISSMTGGGMDMGGGSALGDAATMAATDVAADGAGSLLSKTGSKLSGGLGKVGEFLSKGASKVGNFAKSLNPIEALKAKLPQIGKGFGKFAKKIPVIGTLIEGMFTASDINAIVAEGGTKDEVYQDIGRRALQGIGGIAGGIGASAITTGLSATGIPAFLLNGIAYTLGDMAGRWLFGQIADLVGAKPIGEAISKTFGLEDDIAAANKQNPEKQTITANDFTIKTNPADTLVMAGGTQFGQETNDLLRELVTAVKQGGTVYIDGDKAGRAIMMGSYKTA